MKISVIIPTLNEADAIGPAVLAIRDQEFDEVLIADGGSRDGTRERAAAAGAVIVEAPRGRSIQMNTGARASKGDVLLFLHADTRLPANARHAIERALGDRRVLGGAFRVRYEPEGWLWRIVSFQVNVRSCWTVPWGDQGLFVRREFFSNTGGYRPWRLMEDVEMAHRIKKHGRIEILHPPATLSSRRFRDQGFFRTGVKNQLLMAAYYAGVPPDRLARFYKYDLPPPGDRP